MNKDKIVEILSKWINDYQLEPYQAPNNEPDLNEWATEILNSIQTLDRDKIAEILEENSGLIYGAIEYGGGPEENTYNHIAGLIVDSIKTLNRDKVEDILHKNTDHPNDVLHTSQYFKVACEICNLAVPEGEVIAEGKVVFDEIAGVHIGNKTILYMDDELSDYEGKTIQIIIKEVGDDKL
jgi:hypothetical protein